MSTITSTNINPIITLLKPGNRGLNMKGFVTIMIAAALILAQGALPTPARAASGKYIAYIGTLGKDTGIFAYRFDAATGALESLGEVAKAAKPSFLTLHPNGRFLYSADEVAQGLLRAFAIDPKTGKLTLLNTASSSGAGPAFVGIDPSGKVVMAANYGDGSLGACTVGADGRLSEPTEKIQNTGSSVNPARQKGPHAHSINASPDGRFALAADLGLDKLFVYKLDAAHGKLVPNDPPFAKLAPGAGPRHIAFSPDARFVYVINEMLCAVTVFAWDAAAGTLKEVQTISTLPQDFKGQNTSAEVRVHPSGKFLYGSNRGQDAIAVFAIDPATGKLASVGWTPTGGKTPRNFNLDPTGKWLIAANQSGNSLRVFAIDQQTGKLTDTGKSYDIEGPSCIKFLPVE